MAITFTPGLTPTFHELITDSAKESEKQIVALITSGTAYENKLQAPITAMTTRMDTVIAALSISYAQTNDIEFSAKFANAAAAVVVGKNGTATATIQEIQELLLAE